MMMSNSEHQPDKPAVVLLSGGLDSATTLAIAKDLGYTCHAISFDYGQKQRVELQAAANLASDMAIASHRTLRFELGFPPGGPASRHIHAHAVAEGSDMEQASRASRCLTTESTAKAAEAPSTGTPTIETPAVEHESHGGVELGDRVLREAGVPRR